MVSAAADLHFDAQGRPVHDKAFRVRRFLNWFPMGLAYAFLYWGRYNLTVAKNALGVLMTNADFGIIFAVGTVVYGLAFVVNGPLTDRVGGRRGILIATAGSLAMNLAMGAFIQHVLSSTDPGSANLRLWMSVLYGVNMYFQSFAAVAIIKVNSNWFHLRERGGFSGIFGTMISSGIFFAYTVSEQVVSVVTKDVKPGERADLGWVFFAPAIALGTMFLVELFLLRDRPGQAGFSDFDAGDANDHADTGPGAMGVIIAMLRNPIILTLAAIEFCTGVLRNGVWHWFNIYAKQVWSLPTSHPLILGDWTLTQVLVGGAIVVAGLSLMPRSKGTRGIGFVVMVAGLAFFVPAGWGGFIFAAGVFGGNVAGWVSDLFFQSRRAPAAGGLYAIITACAIAMIFCLGGTTTEIAWVKGKDNPLKPGDRIVSVAGVTELNAWTDVTRAFRCVQSECKGNARWDSGACMCSESPSTTDNAAAVSTGSIPISVVRGTETLELLVPDPLKAARAGDERKLSAGPVLTLSPWWLAILIFILSFAVIGTHGLLSGTASMDFGGKKAAATAAGVIDGFVYLGTGLQSLALGYITSVNWAYWPVFLVPWAAIGFFLCTRIWNVKPSRSGGH